MAPVAQTMDAPRVAVLCGRSLLAEGIIALLQGRGIEAVTVAADESGLALHLKELHPQAVILDGSDPLVSSELTVMALLELCPNSYVLRLDPESQALDLYQRQQWRAIRGEDLVRLLATAPSRGPTAA